MNATKTIWFMTRNNKKFGPFSGGQIKSGFKSGKLLPTDLFWNESMAGWQKVEAITELSGCLVSPVVQKSLHRTEPMVENWHYSRNGEQFGPVSGGELKRLAVSGQLDSSDLIFKEGMANWVEAKKIKGLFPIVSAKVPPPIPPTAGVPTLPSISRRIDRKPNDNDPRQNDYEFSLPKENNVTANLSRGWKEVFELIEKGGGVGLPNKKDLTFNEKYRINSNFIAFLFGPWYYIFKGMWKKGITLLVLNVLIACIYPPACLIVPCVACQFANIDYYKKIKLGRNGWW